MSGADEDPHPVQTLVNSWLWSIMLPSALIAWSATQRLIWVVLASLSTPLLAIAQGAIGILQFRVLFGDAPLPLTPSHGVVVVSPSDKPVGQASTPTSSSTLAAHKSLLRSAVSQSPVRLLVIGDSLAIGVGQSSSSTPIMPEVMAKTLSKQLGRVVYWTCHGAPGASTGWIVRELERGIDYLAEEDDDSFSEQPVTSSESCSSTDDSSSEDSRSGGAAAEGWIRRGMVDAGGDESSEAQLAVWQDRLAHHRKRFNPDVLGPYDIVVVLTGSNDLKSAFFPFLLTGEDAEFRRQAKERGGSYTQELMRLMETLRSKMRIQLLNIRTSVMESVEAATETVREKVEVTMERLAPGSSERLGLHRIEPAPEQERSPSKRMAAQPETVSASSIQRGNSRNFPLIVLPGMPARALPIFRKVPLRWLAVPIVDIMDKHKRDLARLHPGEVLFVKAPSVADLADYEERKGRVWAERCHEDTVLALRDVRKRDRQRIEADMQAYYQQKGADGEGGWSLFPPARGTKVFSVDQIHPNDRGYDFWGRYIGRAIVDAWHDKKQL